MTARGVAGRIEAPPGSRLDPVLAESNVLSGLLARRGELDRTMGHHRRELNRLVGAVGRADATIRRSGPIDDRVICAVCRCIGRNRWLGPGRRQRSVLETSCDAVEPWAARDLVRGAAVTPKGEARGPSRPSGGDADGCCPGGLAAWWPTVWLAAARLRPGPPAEPARPPTDRWRPANATCTRIRRHSSRMDPTVRILPPPSSVLVRGPLTRRTRGTGLERRA